MTIDVSGPFAGPGELFTYHLTYGPEPEDAEADAEPVGPAEVEVRVTYANGVFAVDTAVRVRFRLRCARCLASFEYQTETGFSEQYEQNEIADGRIDLTEKVRDAVIGAPPMKALCREDCPGLCAQCGASLAEGPCGCSDAEIDPRLESLARLLAGHQKKGVE